MNADPAHLHWNQFFLSKAQPGILAGLCRYTGKDSETWLSSIPRRWNWTAVQATLADWLLRTVLDLRYIELDRFSRRSTQG